MSSESSISSSNDRSSLSFELLFVSWVILASSNSCSCKVLMLFPFVVLSCMGVVYEMRFVEFSVEIVCSGEEIDVNWWGIHGWFDNVSWMVVIIF